MTSNLTDINEAVALEEGNHGAADNTGEANGDGLRQRSAAKPLEKPQAVQGGARQLSVASKAYDVDHTGKLDEAQQKMRELDRSGRGFIKNEGTNHNIEAMLSVCFVAFLTTMCHSLCRAL